MFKSFKIVLIVIFLVVCSVYSSNAVIIADNCENIVETAKIVDKPDLFTDSEVVFEYVNREEMSYILAAPKDIDTDKEMPVLVYLHSYGETGEDLNMLENRAFILHMIKRHKNHFGRTFNGYIIVPQTPDPNWNDKSEQVKDIVDEFAQTHKIDINNIAISGISMGGAGVCVFVTTKRDDGKTFYSRALIVSESPLTRSALNKIKKTHIPVYGIEAMSEYKTGKFIKALSKTNEVMYVKAGKNHNDVGRYVFIIDENNNNQSDVIEWLFPEYNH